MNFLLSNLEVALDETHMVVGEKLFEENKVTSLAEGQRNLWVAEVDGFEVEMQITPSRVKAVSCECKVFLKEKMCGHVAGGLFALRRHFSENKSKKKKEPKQKEKIYHKLTTSAILETVNPEELKAFVGKYAKQNRNFALALSTRFASAVPLRDNHGKYQQIFSQLVQSIRKKNNMVSAVGKKQFLKTCREFLNQANDAIAMRHFVESWAILASTVGTMPIVIRNTEGDKSDLLELAEDVFKKIDELVAQPLSPELNTDVWDYFIAETPKKSNRTGDLAIFFLERLFELSDDESKKAQLSEMLWDNWKYKELLSESHRSSLIEVMVHLYNLPEFTERANDFKNSIVDSFNDFNIAVEKAQATGHTSFAKALIQKGNEAFTSNLFRDQIEYLNFQLAINEKDAAKVIELGKKILVKSGDVTILSHCQKFAGKNWKKLRSEIIKDVKAQKTPIKNRLLPQIFAHEKMLDELQDFLLNRNSLDLATQFDHHFVPEKQQELTILYKALFDQYLSEHFGEQPSKYILKIFAHLRKINAEKVVDNLAEFIRKKYPRRMELAIELMTI